MTSPLASAPTRTGFWLKNRRLAIAFVAGIICTGVAGAMGGLAVVEFGLYDASATAQHTKLVSWAIHKTFKQSVHLRARETPSAPKFSEDQVVAGFQQYQTECMACHGGPGVPRADWVKGLEPTPPFLLDASKRWSASELTYILQKGVKMSAMPSWGATRSKEQVAEVVAFLEALPEISPAQFRDMQRRYPATPAPSASSAGDTQNLAAAGSTPH